VVEAFGERTSAEVIGGHLVSENLLQTRSTVCYSTEQEVKQTKKLETQIVKRRGPAGTHRFGRSHDVGFDTKRDVAARGIAIGEVSVFVSEHRPKSVLIKVVDDGGS